MDRFTWIDFYRELMDKILEYRGKGNELVDKVSKVYEIANKNGASIRNNMSDSQIAKYNITDLNNVDPFTVMGVINRDLLIEKKIKLCEGFKEVFGIEADVPTDFNAIPVFQNQNAWVISSNYDVWNLIESAIKYADTGEGRDEFISNFNLLYSRKSSLAYITFGLFWIRPLTFIGFDANTINYVTDNYPDLAENLKSYKPTAEQYLAVCDGLKSKYADNKVETNNLELSYNAYVYSKVFVFQCNPKSYNISDAIQNLDKMVYAVRKLKKEIIVGSRVYIWMSGSNSGVIAKAKVVSEVGKHTDPEGDAYYTEGNGPDDSENVWIEFTDKKADSIIRKELINSVKGMEKFGFGQGTNFKISMEQARILDDLIEGKEVETISDSSQITEEWYPSADEYDSGITKEKWLEILPDLLGPTWGGVMAMFYTENEGATCKTLGIKFNTDFHSIRSRCVQMAQKVHEITNCPVIEDEGRTSYWVILFQGRDTTSKEEGSYIWKLRPELYDALTELNVLKWLPKTEDELTEDVEETVYYSYESGDQSGENLIVYGTPGCGKSYYVKKKTENECAEDNIIRTTFYQDYTNTDFIGQILPRIVNRDVTYEFKPGPFTIALEKAIKNPDEKVALVIEELNRGNAASIFGEIFQLLDREKKGEYVGRSTYFVVNTHIQDYLNNRLADEGIVLDKIMIPGNLSIYATMNTSDQNVFTLDTAFKRRWKYKKLPNKFASDHAFKNYFIPGMENVTWEQFVRDINDHIVSSMNSLMAEDKQLGVYFVEEELLNKTPEDNTEEKIREFAYKIFEYLWDDVVKYNRQQWFKSAKTLDELLDLYELLAKDNRGKELFNDGIIK